MLFNSFQFAVFFIIVYSLYISLNHKWQNRLLLIASYVFYGAWDWRFLSLIFFSTILDYFCGLKIQGSETTKTRRSFLFLSIFGNLTVLGFFKYYNFFAANLQILLNNFNVGIQPQLLSIILPIGISFYTFQTMSYTIDIYQRQMAATKKFLDFALFVAFFPQLVAGPIERAKHLLPQILSPRKFRLDWFYEGCYLIFWGLFQKVFIADNLAKIVDPVFAIDPPYNGFKVLIALYAFAFQIFCDFAGYSNIARGLSRLMGFDIMVNFNLPYFSTNPREFWKRWHISLSGWLRDYLYIPLGGNRKGNFITYRNLIITMLLGGLWHGAAWTFVIWGAYHGLLLILFRLIKPFMSRITFRGPLFFRNIWFMVKVLFFFHLICLGWLIFRAQNLTQVFSMLYSLVYNFDVSQNLMILNNWKYLIIHLWLLCLLHLVCFYKKNLFVVFTFSAPVRCLIYLIIYFSLILFGAKDAQEFIYFQF
jgi:D-alanyl-lipoteichoic acid acyltransferase DltB (MBOAT superfamily)